MADAESGAEVQLPIHLQVPSNFVAEYDQVISMLIHCNEDTVQLTANEYKSYVLGLWHWRQEFLMSNSDYSGSAQAMMEGEAPE